MMSKHYLTQLNAARAARAALMGWSLEPTNSFRLTLSEKLFYGIRTNPTPRNKRNYITTK
jgi:hypothetical protein